MSTATAPLPAVRTRETDGELVVEIPLAAGHGDVRVTFGTGRLTIVVPRPREPRPAWHVNPNVVPD